MNCNFNALLPLVCVCHVQPDILPYGSFFQKFHSFQKLCSRVPIFILLLLFFYTQHGQHERKATIHVDLRLYHHYSLLFYDSICIYYLDIRMAIRCAVRNTEITL